ncbi:hypothetical protein BY458DRAFT_8346 [Sporodiniella umbellata]|nr:hypothetical protein BY458DRAFT_8346 [Sporodiniella umbellata]
MKPQTQNVLFRRSQRKRDKISILSTEGFCISSIQHRLWDHVFTITFMDLSCNEIEDIPYSLPIATPNLQHFNISFNRITYLPQTIGRWEKMTSLVLEVADGQNIIKILPRSMINMKNLKRFEAKNCGLSCIPSKFFPVSIQSINVSGNRLLHFLPRLFAGKLTSLKFLDLSNNLITGLFINLPTYIPNIEFLAIDGNEIHLIPSTIQLCRNLSTFKISLVDGRNSMRTLPMSMKKLTRLKYVHASYCSITDLKSNTFSTSLVSINLRGNQILRIRGSIFNGSVETIDLRDNKINFIGVGNFGSLTKNINLRNNRLRRLDSVIFPRGSSKLISLNLSFNQITEISKRVPKVLPNLKHLNLAHNQIKELPETIGLWQEMETLILSHAISTLPTGIGNMARLKKIDLRYCKIKRLEPNIFGPLLESICLEGNEITELTVEPFINCVNLKNLNLKKNKIRYIYDSFVQCVINSKIRCLSLGGNELLMLPWEFLLPEPITIHYHPNPFNRSRVESTDERSKLAYHIAIEKISYIPVPNIPHQNVRFEFSADNAPHQELFCKKDGDLIDAFNRTNYLDPQNKAPVTSDHFKNCGRVVFSLKEIALRYAYQYRELVSIPPRFQKMMKPQKICYVCECPFYNEWLALIKWELFLLNCVLCKAKVCSYECHETHMEYTEEICTVI